MAASWLLLVATLPLRAVSFQSDSVHVGELVESLSRQSGLRLACDGGLAKEAVVAEFDKQPIEDVLERLALVTGAEWRDSGEERRLGRSSSLVARQTREEREKLRRAWDRILANRLDEIAKLPPLDRHQAERMVGSRLSDDPSRETALAEREYIGGNNPLAIFLVRMLAAVGANEIARMEFGERVVYSDIPTRMQRPLPTAVTGELAKLRSEVRELVAARSRVHDPERPRTIFAETVAFGSGEVESYIKTLVAIQKTAPLRLRYSVFLVDSAGSLIAYLDARFPDPIKETASISASGDKLSISREALDFAKLASAAGVQAGSGYARSLPDGTSISLSYYVPFSEAEGVPSDRGLGKYLCDPVKYDPLGFYCGPLLRQAARSPRRPLLATVDDVAIQALGGLIGSDRVATVDALLSFLLQSYVPESHRVPHCDLLPDSDWMLLRPSLLVSARRERFDRASARELVGAIRAHGYCELEAVIRYIGRRQLLPRITSLDRILISHAVPEVEPFSIQAMLDSPIDLLSQLGAHALIPDRPLVARLEDASPPVRELIRRWLFWTHRLAISPPPGNPVNVPKVSALEREPTERFPDGIPADAIIQISSYAFPAVVARASNRHVFNLSVYALAEHERQKGETFLDVKRREYVAFRPATQYLVTAAVRTPSEQLIERKLTLTVPDRSTSFVPRKDLPSSMLDQIENARKWLRKPANPKF